MSDSPIYDRLMGEWSRVPGTFTPDELATVLRARRLCGMPERPALMPVAADSRVNRMSGQAVIPVKTLREKAAVEQDTVETDIRTLVSA